MSDFLSNRQAIKETIKAIREGFHICSERGINPKEEKVNRLYYLPLFICVPIVKKIFSNEDMGLMFDGYLKQSTDEVKKMLVSVIDTSGEYDMKMPYLKRLHHSLEKL